MRRLAAAVLLTLLSAPAAATDEPDAYRQTDYRAPVPETLEGATVVDDDAAYALWKTGTVVFIDVLPQAPRPRGLPAGTIWRDKPRETIPGAVWLPDVGYGALAPVVDEWFRDELAKATGGRNVPVVFFCLADCWMSWNAARRAHREYGYTRVFWYPDGTDGWTFEGWPTETVTPPARPG